jgi:DNA invertase Pin-like site-specific DNA recombinase
MKNYFGYIRVSTPKQGTKGCSLQEQRSSIEEYARKNNLEIVEWYEDRVTAAKKGRHQFDRMVSGLDQGRAQGVIIHKIDRSARNFADWGHLGELLDRGVEVWVAHDSLDLTTRSGRLMADIQAVLAVDYIRNLRDEVNKGLNGRLKQGIYPFKAPRGYLDSGGGKPKRIDPVLGPIVRAAFELYDTGNYGLRELRVVLCQRGLCAAPGKPLSLASLGLVLHNPFYTGIIQLRDGRTFQGVHEPLISRGLFDRVQDRLAGKHTAKTRVFRHVFRRLLSCLGCGRSLIGELQKGHIYYRCHMPECRGNTIREERVIELLSGFLELFVMDEQDLRDLRDLLLQADDVVQRAAADRDAGLKLALGKLDERRTRLTDALIDGKIDAEAFDQRNAALLAERRGIQEQIEAPTISPADELLKKLELGKRAYLLSISEFESEIRDALKLTLSNLEVGGKEPVLRPSFPFDEIAKARLVHGGPHTRDTYRKEDPAPNKEFLNLLPPLRAEPKVLRRADGTWIQASSSLKPT